MKKSIIRLPVELPVIEVQPDFIAKRDSLVIANNTLPTVKDAESNEKVTAHCVEIKKLVKEVEEAEASVRGPINDWMKKLRSKRDEYLAPLAEILNVRGKQVAAFREAERVRVEAEERAKQAEIERKLREAEEAQAKAARAAERMATEAGLERALKAEQQAAQAAEDLRAAAAAPVAAVSKAAGSAVRKELRWEVTDIHALYTAAPHLVRLEPNAAAIKASVKPGQGIPGLRVWEEAAASFRSR